MLLKELFFVIWFFAPAGLANMSAFLASKIPLLKKLNQPVDARLKFRGKRIFGSHKTIRGFIFGTVMAIIGVSIEVLLYNVIPFFRTIIPINYAAINPLLLGLLLGFGALTGDAVKSFFKRQLSIPPGKSWVPFDQIDYILGGMIFTYIYLPLSAMQYVLLFAVWFFLHIVINFYGYILKLKRQPI